MKTDLGKQTRNIPFAPSVYEHAARLVERSPWEVSRDAELMAEGHIRAHRLYDHNPIAVGIDIYNLEAEAYGAVVAQPTRGGIPAISRPTFSDCTDLLDLPAFEPAVAGRIPMILEVGKKIARDCPDADVRVPVAGPFSITTNLLGFENLLMQVATRPGVVRQALHHLVAGQIGFCRAVMDNGLGVALFESAATPPLMSPHQFREVEFPPLDELIHATAHITGRAPSCIIGGNTEPILQVLLQTGTTYVCAPVGTDQVAFMKTMEAYPDVMVRVNMDPWPLVTRNVEALEKEVDRVLDLAKNRRRVCIGTGALPFEAEPEMVLKAKDLIRSKTVH